MKYSVALTTSIHEEALNHLVRSDGQEDLCFALWHPGEGSARMTAFIHSLILPIEGERQIHRNASFMPEYFQRVIELAKKHKANIAFMHSHLGPGWQDMSSDDISAELSRAAATKAVTGFPLVGLTLGTDGAWSARFWEKIGPRKYKAFWCENVRVVGPRGLEITYMDKLLPPPQFRERLKRTTTSWGLKKQQKLARLKIGVVGAGSVGTIVAETLARMGVKSIKLIDFDVIEELNLDRLLHATEKDIGKYKVETLAKALEKSATAEDFQVDPLNFSIVEEMGFREALDCDILFSCVDRPWPRSVLNLISSAYLIPVIDGGIAVVTKENGSIHRADWKAHTILPGRKCMECLGQFDPSYVQAEREGFLDDPEYIKSLSNNHPIRQNQNVFAFSLSTASLEILQMLSIVIVPLGISDIGCLNYHFVTGNIDIDKESICSEGCLFGLFTGLGDSVGFKITGRHDKAEETRNNFNRRQGLLPRLRDILRL